MISANDWQLGKGEGGGTEATVDHLVGSFDAWRQHRRWLAKTGRRPSSAVIANTGDLTERVQGHYPSQPFTVDLNDREQQKVARSLLMRLVYALQLDGRVLTVPAKGGATQVLGRLPGRIHPNAGLNRSADGAFVYATLTTYESELMLANLATH